ncbi:hypothetical protein PROFUN_16650, partial [Planoprotostelium fungivorum]
MEASKIMFFRLPENSIYVFRRVLVEIRNCCFSNERNGRYTRKHDRQFFQGLNLSSPSDQEREMPILSPILVRPSLSHKKQPKHKDSQDRLLTCILP